MNRGMFLKPDIRLGVVPTHLRFVGGIVPGADGRLPRNNAAELRIIAGMKELCALSPVKMD